MESLFVCYTILNTVTWLFEIGVDALLAVKQKSTNYTL